jgi:cytochrome c oxidase subunit II
VNEMWVDPHAAGVYLGQCAQFCGAQHAKMLLRVFVDTPEQFRQWIANQQQAQESGTQSISPAPSTNPAPTQPNTGNSGSGAPPDVSASRGEVSTHLAEASQDITPEQGRRVFEEQACMNCHTVSGTVANGRYGPDLTHLMSRQTIAAGIVPNTPDHLQAWITDPNDLKPGTLMPAMHLTDTQNAQITAYLLTLH